MLKDDSIDHLMHRTSALNMACKGIQSGRSNCTSILAGSVMLSRWITNIHNLGKLIEGTMVLHGDVLQSCCNGIRQMILHPIALNLFTISEPWSD